MKKFLASAALLLCVFSTGLPTVHAEQPLDTVAVTGTARKMVAPDMATVTFSYETTGDTVEAVRQRRSNVNKGSSQTYGPGDFQC